MNTNFDILFNKEIPTALDSLCDLNDIVFEKMKEKDITLRWTKEKYWEEYGFYIDSSDKSKNLFFGLWFDLWELKSAPLCICLGLKKNIDSTIRDNFRDYVKSLNNENFKFTDFEGSPVLYFDKTYFQDLKDWEDVYNLIKQIMEQLKFNLYFNK